MSPSPTAAPARLLTQAASERQTGALLIGGRPGGAVYLIEGAVMYAESPAAPGVGEILTSSGRLAGRTWQAALDAGATSALVGRYLVDHGHLTQGELELCVLGALYDAAYFALSPAAAPVEFRADATHWLGPVVRVTAAAVNREARRRSRLLDETFPHPEVDSAPVLPVPRPPRERVTLTAPQWELLVHADGQRTPADLALLLGRSGYATILELRRLAALGLIESFPDRTADTQEFIRLPNVLGIAVDVHRPQVVAANGVFRPAAAPGDPPAPEPEPAGVTDRPARLARRKPGAKLPRELAGPAEKHTGTDEVLLSRIRTALRALR